MRIAFGGNRPCRRSSSTANGASTTTAIQHRRKAAVGAVASARMTNRPADPSRTAARMTPSTGRGLGAGGGPPARD
ncbi:hypothetical protein [Brevibacterium aurantiacum]|uniref:hypothetical protein n=1 Tax=Brevibacterium aurantiacum TaxID=273384 RepID=UPI001081563F|nr:hypothetical protein [Brevibacterium aurantiacum]